MENELIKLASSQGIWVSLTIFLVFYIFKSQEKRDLKQEEREMKYIELIDNLSEKFNILKEVKNDLEEIKNIFLR